MKSPGKPELIYPIQQIILLAGCSSAAPDSSSDLQVKNKKYWPALELY
jgi:hypothetical protein